MAMGKRTSEQAPLWIPTTELPVSPGHPFYVRLNEVLDGAGFDRFVEDQCRPFYAPVMGRPSLAPAGTSACCWSAISKASTRSAGSPGERRTRWRYGISWGLGLDEA